MIKQESSCWLIARHCWLLSAKLSWQFVTSGLCTSSMHMPATTRPGILLLLQTWRHDILLL